MAVGADLNPAGRRRLLALVAVVLLAHVLALTAFSRWQARSSLLKPMVEPMYTRLLQPQAPAPPALVAAAPVAPAPAAPTARMRATPSVPERISRTAAPAQAEPTAPAPRPEPGPVRAHEGEPAAESTLASEAAPSPETLPRPPIEPAAAAPAAALAPELAAPPADAQPDAGATDSLGTAASTPATAPAGPAPAPSAAAAAASPAPGATAPPPDGWPADTRLRYALGGRFRSGDLYGQARVLWQREGGRYQVRVEVDVTVFATVVMTSQGEVGPQTLHPQAYEEVRNGKPRGLLRMGESEVMLPNGKVLPRPPQLQDTASQFVDLSHRFASGLERLEVGRAVSFWMARPGAVDLWTYDIVGKDRLVTALGDVDAFHLKPRPIAHPRGNITVEMWFAPALQYLPVRVRVKMGEEAHVDLLVEAIEQR